MADSFGDRLKHAWNAFMNRDPPYGQFLSPRDFAGYGQGSSYRPDRPRLTRGNERSIITTVYNRIATDCSSILINHVRLDENGRYLSTITSGLNNCLTIEANKDQTGRAFIHDIVLSMMDDGCVAIVPIDTGDNPIKGLYDIYTMRTGKIVQWYPNYVKVNVYNDRTGLREDLIMPKKIVGIIENPFFAVMNEPNSTMQRLIRKLNLLDAIDEQSGAGKLDLIVQLPYVIKTEQRKIQAENRRKEIETQLANSKYGIAYTDGTERITQLNRSIENNLMQQVQYLTDTLYSQLGITKEILEGTASDTVMTNYNNRTIEPIMSTICDEMKRKFLTKTGRSQGQSIFYFKDPFKLVPVSQIAEITDKMTRNEVMSSNEVRQILGMKPVDDPRADELKNKNINAQTGQEFANVKATEPMSSITTQKEVATE